MARERDACIYRRECKGDDGNGNSIANNINSPAFLCQFRESWSFDNLPLPFLPDRLLFPFLYQLISLGFRLIHHFVCRDFPFFSSRTLPSSPRQVARIFPFSFREIIRLSTISIFPSPAILTSNTVLGHLHPSSHETSKLKCNFHFSGVFVGMLARGKPLAN